MTTRSAVRVVLTIVTVFMCWEFGSRMFAAPPAACGVAAEEAQNRESD